MIYNEDSVGISYSLSYALFTRTSIYAFMQPITVSSMRC